MKKSLPNGGFPPIKICTSKNIDKSTKISKERHYSNNNNVKNVNIRDILKPSKPFILQSDGESVEIV